MVRNVIVKEGMRLRYVTPLDPQCGLNNQIVTVHKGLHGWYVRWPDGHRSCENASGITDNTIESSCWEIIDEVVTSAPHYTPDQIKIANTKQDATHCVACGALLKRPFTGHDSFKYKHCPMCEP